MKKDDIVQSLIAFIEKASKRSNLDPDRDIVDMEYINSLIIMQLILYIEKEYEISVDNNVLGSKQFHTINGISEYIFTKIEEM